MRKTFFKTITELAKTDNRIYLLVGDIGYGLVEEFANEYPDRFINVGVAEQNMIGIATGLALSGKIVFCYSIANFPTLRCLEQIRNDACYHKSNVIIVAGGTGLGYGSLGTTHHATEDLAIMRSLPNMTVVAPSDPIETSCAVKEMAQGIGTCYLRLDRLGNQIIHEPNLDFKIGKSITLRGGLVNANLIVTGIMLGTGLKVADNLKRQGIELGVIQMHTIKPLDKEVIYNCLETSPNLFTLEEHSKIGGLGSAVAGALAETGKRFNFKRFGIADSFAPVGDYEYLLKHYHLTVEDIVGEIKSNLK
jgi:transketolase